MYPFLYMDKLFSQLLFFKRMMNDEEDPQVQNLFYFFPFLINAGDGCNSKQK